jgi:hypothetical protein
MTAQMWVIIVGVLGGLGLGWLTAPTPQAEAVAALGIPALAHPSSEAAEARTRLTALGLNPAPALDEGPPDVALLFRRDLTAIEERQGGFVVWIVDFNQTTQRRALRVGDVYQDRWRVERITPQAVELRRQREVRTIDVFASSGIEP